ncbi:hypothetical protein R69619_03332 [Paraburkholderia nemoris]|uniref:hypothetical protein n=1 Tax=Paraburkholderia nemoris TaxID=2793076 RepID=UPI00190C2DD8|nr:hypothetical protein [Paraburkholderia nemoris]MBK3743350.1 hypothetical protein [Paraburkholderia aspalathi]CAE6760068.1 hypothetical protein R69619_03332 [Paraburkholderia nemoris]
MTTDQTVGKTQSQAVKPSTVGSAQRGAEAKRAANAGSSRRAGPGATTEKGERFTGKALKSAVGDWLKRAKAASKALDENMNALKLANDSGNEQLQALCQQMVEALFAHLLELATSAQDLAESIQAEKQATPQAEETTDETEAPETGTGEIPHSGAVAGALDASAMDAGRAGVLDHFAAVGVDHAATVDAATRLQIEQAEWKKHALKHALDNGDEAEAYRIRFGLDRPAVVGDAESVYAGLSFERGAK